ncbi:hypothetical protein [Bradyrhizobium ottawaense]|uniref:hypothetical protein n=1 Tax=Bradyrhizobium ottawaense TaxID=931866 RepID=UPI0030F4746C
MIKAGGMARLGGRLVKVCSITNYFAECIWFDHAGRIHSASVDVETLEPIWVTPRTLWPEVNQLPDWVAEQREIKAKEKRRAKHRKPKPSLRIKRAGLAPGLAKELQV